MAELQSDKEKTTSAQVNAYLLNCSACEISQARQQFFALFLFFRHADNARGGWCVWNGLGGSILVSLVQWASIQNIFSFVVPGGGAAAGAAVLRLPISSMAAVAHTDLTPKSMSSMAAPLEVPEWSYIGKKILAPMVRVCTLPTRLQCLRVRKVRC